MRINGFRGQYAWLSNFHGAVTVNGRAFATVEHAFQAAKTVIRSEQERVRLAATPAAAKRLGRRVTLRPGWDGALKLRVMRKLVRMKFEQNARLRVLLLDTGSAELVEFNTWGDTYWGVAYNSALGVAVGDNHLGRILMEIRAELS